VFVGERGKLQITFIFDFFSDRTQLGNDQLIGVRTVGKD
jgi:hypothetical protein